MQDPGRGKGVDAGAGRGREVRDAAHPGQTAALAWQPRAAGQRGGRRRAHGPQSDHPRTSAARGSFLWVTDGTLEQWQEGLTGWTSGPGGNPRKQPGGRAAGAEEREGQMSADPSAHTRRGPVRVVGRKEGRTRGHRPGCGLRAGAGLKLP